MRVLCLKDFAEDRLGLVVFHRGQVADRDRELLGTVHHPFQKLISYVESQADAAVRDLRGVLERDEAAMAGLIVMDELGDRKTRNFAREMASAGDMAMLGKKYARMQLLTVPEILDGRRFETPSVVGRGDQTPVLPGSQRRQRRTKEQTELVL